jgi:alanine-glyoxylate transaminase / serine-glyoxylate transaminase / serine-pyruvate transaminase
MGGKFYRLRGAAKVERFGQDCRSATIARAGRTPKIFAIWESPTMTNRLDAIPDILLMGPGPSAVHPDVYRALAKPTLGHLDPAFIALMDDAKGLLQQVMRTRNHVTFPISGTGSAGMEAAFANLVEPGDRVLVLVNGFFGQRMTDVAARLGAVVETVEFEWGTPVVADAVEQKLAGSPYNVVAMVHAETSTGVANPVADVGRLVRPTGALFVVDGVTSLGGMPVEVDGWGIDAFYSCSQKGLSCPPGLSPFSLSDRAVAQLLARKTKVASWYLDASLLVNYWEGSKRAYHHTAPINMIYGLYQSLLNVTTEGLDAVFARHQEVHRQLVAGLEKLGLEVFVRPECRLPMLTLVKVPAGVEEARVRGRLLTEHKIEIGAGLGPLAGQVWRVGIMGHAARAENVERFLWALQQVLK